jgi:hypothetical protein
MCNEFNSIKHGSWFQHGNLTFQEVLFLTTSCAANPPNLSNKSICLVELRSRTGDSSVERPCLYKFRNALKRSAVLTKSMRTSLVGSNIIAAPR